MERVRTSDEVYVGAPASVVFRAIDDIERAGSWWPRVDVRRAGDRLALGLPYGRRARLRCEARVTRVRRGEGLVWEIDRGEVRGTAEWWLEPFKVGTIVHVFLDLVPGDRAAKHGMARRVHRHRLAFRRGMNAVKDRLEGR